MFMDYEEIVIEAALDIYDEYDVSMEEAVDIAMEKVYRSPDGYKMKELREKDPNVNCVNSNEYWRAQSKDGAFWYALRSAKNGGNNDPDRRYTYDVVSRLHGDFGYNNGKNALRKIKFKDRVIDRDKRRIDPKTGIAVGAGAAALGAGGVALYKYRKKKLAEAAKAKREAEEAKAAAKREEAKDAVAQAKEASIYFDYD
jgi:hypothetical protein